MLHVWNILKRYPALLLLVAVYIASTGVVIANFWRGRERAAGERQKVILRMAHWQLEPGIRDALDWLGKEYAKLHPNVELRQILIPEEGYFRWVNTQLIGRTAPDMIECGLGGTQELWRTFFARYFIPLDQYVDEPNPYNKGTELESVPWRKTYFDEMEGGYEETLQSYFRVPLSAFTLRLYYNADMVEAVWRPEERGCAFPQTQAQFIELCELLKKKGGPGFVPIAGAKYSFERIDRIFQTAMTANYLDRLDVNYDGTVSQMESAGPLYTGRVSLLEPALRDNFELLRQVSDYSPPGATALDRDEAVFLFLQGHAAMIPTGSWDYSSLAEQAEFRVGVSDIPLPGPDDPKYGPYVAGQPTEADTRGAFPFAISKTSAHPDVALDFLRFASSLRINEELNKRMFWLPVIVGARPRKELEPFMPRIEGYSLAFEYVGPNTQLSYEQERPLYLSRKVEYEEFVARYMRAYRRDLPDGVRETVRNLEQTLDEQMRFAALRRAALAGAPGAREALTGEPSVQLKRILEAYVTQLNARDHEVRVWVENVRVGPRF